MKNKITKIGMIVFLALLAGGTYGIPPIKVDEPVEKVPNVKKKKAGDECKTSDECQQHQTCRNIGDKRVCTVPARVDIPKT